MNPPKRAAGGVDVSSQSPPVDRDEVIYQKLEQIHRVAVAAQEGVAAHDVRAAKTDEILAGLTASTAQILHHVARGAERDADQTGRIATLELHARLAGMQAGTEAGAEAGDAAGTEAGKAAGKSAGSKAGLIAGPAVVTVAAVLWELGKLIYAALHG